MRAKLLFLLMAPVAGAFAVENGALYRSVEEQNKTLVALRSQLDMDFYANKEENALPNPEVGFVYQWGANGVPDDKIGLEVSQQLEWATILGKKKAVSSEKNAIGLLQYEQSRREILLRVNQLCVELLYNKMAEEQMNKRIDWAKQISEAIEKQMNRGESTSLDFTKSKLVVLEYNSALKNLLMERESLLSELTTLNGGVLPDLSGISLPEDFSVLSFDSLYEEKKKSAPALMIAQQEVKLSEKEYKLARSTMAPDLNVGYSGEWVGEESMQGMSVGIALPLWANKNKVKAARSSRVVASARFDEAENQYRTELKSLYDRLAMQNELMKSYQTEIDNYQGNDLLTKALQGGQITMVDYLNEQLEFMDVLDSKLEVEKEFYLLLAELYWY